MPKLDQPQQGNKKQTPSPKLSLIQASRRRKFIVSIEPPDLAAGSTRPVVRFTGDLTGWEAYLEAGEAVKRAFEHAGPDGVPLFDLKGLTRPTRTPMRLFAGEILDPSAGEHRCFQIIVPIGPIADDVLSHLASFAHSNGIVWSVRDQTVTIDF